MRSSCPRDLADLASQQGSVAASHTATAEWMNVFALTASRHPAQNTNSVATYSLAPDGHTASGAHECPCHVPGTRVAHPRFRSGPGSTFCRKASKYR